MTCQKFLQALGQYVCSLLLVDEYDDGRLEFSTAQNFHQLVALGVLFHYVDDLLRSFHGFAGRADVDHSRTSQVSSSQPLHRRRHSCNKHDSLQNVNKNELNKPGRVNQTNTCRNLFLELKLAINFCSSSASSLSGF